MTSRRERKKDRDVVFAHLKRILRLDRLRLRGPLGALQDEFVLACYRPESPKAGKAGPAARPDAGLSENKLTRA